MSPGDGPGPTGSPLARGWRSVRRAIARRGADDLAVPSLLRLRWLRDTEGLSPTRIRLGILLAVVLSIIAGTFKWVVGDTAHSDLGYLAFLAAVGFSAWYGGLGAGIVATVTSAILEATIFFPPIGVPLIGSVSDLIRLALFLFDGLLVSAVASALRRVSYRQLQATRENGRLLEAERVSRERAEASRQELERLQAVTASLSEAVTPAAVAEAILDRGLIALGATAGAVCRLTDDWTALELVAARAEDRSVRTSSRYPLDRRSHVADALRQRRMLFVPDRAAWDAAYAGTPRLLSAVSLEDGAVAAVPLLVDDRTLGALVFDFPTGRTFDDATRLVIERLGDRCAQALDRALAYEEQRAATERLTRGQARLTWLAHSSEVLASTLDVDAAADAIARAAVPSMADWCVIELDGAPGPVQAVCHPSAPEVAVLRELLWLAPRTMGAWLAPEITNGGGTILRLDPSTIRERIEGPRAVELLERLAVRAVMVVPVVIRRDVVGAITLGTTEPARFDRDGVAVAQDLAGRIAAAIEQASLHAAVSRFKATVDATLDAVFMYDPRTLRLTYVNEGAASLAGIDPAALAGLRVLDLQPSIDEDTFRRRIWPLLTGEVASSTATGTMIRRDGSTLPVSMFTQCVRLPDGTSTMILTARDVTDQIEARTQLARIAQEERHRAAELTAVLEGIHDAVLVVDHDGGIRLANGAARDLGGPAMAGLDELARALGVGTDELPDIAETAVGRTVALPDGRWLDWSSFPTSLRTAGVEDDVGVSTIVMIRDVTRQREAQEAREAFLEVLSHELRTPITTIFGYAKVLERPGSDVDAADVLADIETEADRLYRIVENLLALSRMETGLHVDGEPILLQRLVPDIIAYEARRWPDVSFEIELPDDLPVATGDRTYIEQILRNLLANASKYSDPGREISIVGDTADGAVAIRVLDRGLGIDAAEADKLFDLYYRSPTTARRRAGSGIGLYVCRGLVAAMGGHIWARPRSGGGSEFGFSLPAIATEDDNAPGPADADDDEIASTASARP